MKNILRIFDAWQHSFALVSFCVSVAFLIVLTGISAHRALAFGARTLDRDMRGWLGLFLGGALSCRFAALSNIGANL
jgi:hypothetical protein